MNRLPTSWGEYELTRFPDDPRDPLRAWDAADEYLLRHLDGTKDRSDDRSDDGTDDGTDDRADDGTGQPVPDLSGTVVVVGDRWGALVTALADHYPVQITDSYLARRATEANLARNGVEPAAVRLLTTQDTPPERIDVLLIRVPKSLALLEDQLHRLAPAVHERTVVIGTGMVKEIHTSTLRLFERIIGPTRTSLAVKKARLIFCTPGPGPYGTREAEAANPWPHTYTLPEGIGPVSARTVTNHAGIFCADRLDIGTRFLLQHLPARRGPEHVVDLGCGNGVVGTAAALANPEADVTFVDESYQAVASAEATFRANAAPGTKARFLVGDGLADMAPGTVDLVLNNPPFHSHQATTDKTAWRMFTGARAALRPGGELWVVGNRHLGYHLKLRRLFGTCEVVVGNPKFVILRAVKAADGR
ncbi:methyltransferase [Streptomyces sp. E11-3]|uniref:methyltransferase n=1 Tax=Streptomyces sp. E11-3 TaxID=3110112 RepID=UPI0039811D6C